MIELLNEKLNAALDAQAEAARIHAEAALAVEDGRAPAADLTKASKQLDAAQKRVADLQAATVAAEEAEAARIKREQAAAERARVQAVTEALQQVRQQGARFDAMLDALQDVARDFNEAVKKAYSARPDAGTISQIDRARSSAQDVIVYRLRELLCHEGGSLALSPERTKLERFVNHLPEVN